MINFKILGLGKVQKNLNNFEQELKKSLERSVLISAIKVETDAKKLAPVDTGRLRSSITHDWKGTTARVGTDVNYAPYIELGTYKQKAQPYLYPALQMNMNFIKKKIADIKKVNFKK